MRESERERGDSEFFITERERERFSPRERENACDVER